ncbi:HAMP domain-containing sensor histidine kinase [Actinomadura algeriensis]|uniref:histidine kinase n=1 Tax=Actinomadura algeriensis TaxID=1679523 RepID=A0ABR9K0E6_9ACTN|nr:HAMP domain-containing sensor histidine kinase [Actinomadura algeriensis]MBE1536300.1 two-component system sensor histidine kinase MprB [Actinomadura algeriensis]
MEPAPTNPSPAARARRRPAGRLTGRLTLRARLALLTAIAVALAVAACAAASWTLTRAQLYRELDHRLEAMAGEPPGPGGDRPPHVPPLPRGLRQVLGDCTREPTAGTGLRPPGPPAMMQLVTAGGERCTIPDSGALRVTAADAAVARGDRARALHDGTATTADGATVDVRVLTRPVRTADGSTAALSYALSLEDVQDPLDNLAMLLAAVAALGVLASAGAGLMIARAGLRPVDELTGAVEHIARTEDLDVRIPEEGTDEIARLGRSFNTMTGALAASRERQRRLIADAGHELRTPLTSLRTNIDLLLRADAAGRDLPETTRRTLLTSVKAQMLELTDLVGDLLELARPDETGPVRETVALHDVVARAVDRARLRGPGLTVRDDTRPWYVPGDPASLERAVVNLLDNAVKFSPPGGTVDVRLAGGELTVRDRGPGIPPGDLPHVFERFWRSPSARSLPGSGLGLSIVARSVADGGGTVALEPAAGGGTLARVRLPGTAEPPP